MQLVDRRIPFLEVQVVTIRDARIVAHPLADFCETLSSDREKRTERMTHDMRRDPGKVLLKLIPHKFQKDMERADEIVTVATLPALDFWRDAPRSVHRVLFEKCDKNIRQRNRSRFAVLRPKGFRLLHPERPALNQKPRRTRLDNFVSSQPRFKSGVHDKPNHSRLLLRHDPDWNLPPSLQQGVPKLRLTIFGFRAVVPPSHTDVGGRIRGDYLSLVFEPTEERAQTHHVALSGGFRHTIALLAVESLQVPCFDRRDLRPSHPTGESFQRKTLIFGRKATEFISRQFEGDEGLDLAFHGATKRQIGGICEVESFVDCLILITSFQGDCLSDTTTHTGKVPPPPFLIESFDRYHASRVANRVANRQLEMN